MNNNNNIIDTVLSELSIWKKVIENAVNDALLASSFSSSSTADTATTITTSCINWPHYGLLSLSAPVDVVLFGGSAITFRFLQQIWWWKSERRRVTTREQYTTDTTAEEEAGTASSSWFPPQVATFLSSCLALMVAPYYLSKKHDSHFADVIQNNQLQLRIPTESLSMLASYYYLSFVGGGEQTISERIYTIQLDTILFTSSVVLTSIPLWITRRSRRRRGRGENDYENKSSAFDGRGERTSSTTTRNEIVTPYNGNTKRLHEFISEARQQKQKLKKVAVDPDQLRKQKMKKFLAQDKFKPKGPLQLTPELLQRKRNGLVVVTTGGKGKGNNITTTHTKTNTVTTTPSPRSVVI